MTRNNGAQHMAECLEPWRVRQFPFFELVTTATCANRAAVDHEVAGGRWGSAAAGWLAHKEHHIWNRLESAA